MLKNNIKNIVMIQQLNVCIETQAANPPPPHFLDRSRFSKLKTLNLSCQNKQVKRVDLTQQVQPSTITIF